MYIVRETFTAKPGMAGKMAKLMRKFMANENGVRIMTDLIGDYNTVVMEMQVGSMAEWEDKFNQYRNGTIQMDPEIAAEMKGYTEMWLKGRREVFQVVD